ncbi:hypothetical protein [Pseudomonas reactans]|uniref:hypothetical protein n=1 Tax=Pseudomonas reactans TaxID=117680 RepID=UPI00159FBAE2|nr:hypothetical protein [Pseudomonas reactans]NWC89989.1 hypothetical protein [Pseudomonas reactans]
MPLTKNGFTSDLYDVLVAAKTKHARSGISLRSICEKLYLQRTSVSAKLLQDTLNSAMASGLLPGMLYWYDGKLTFICTRPKN